jgi:hypothetical protein
MSLHDDVDQLLKESDAFIAGGQTQAIVASAEAKLGLSFPPSFREYLLRWGNLSFDGCEYYGLTRNTDFENASIPNCVWFTLRKRSQVGLPGSLVVFRNIDDDEYVCVDTDHALDGEERGIAIWDNTERSVSQSLPVSFIDYLREELLDRRG